MTEDQLLTAVLKRAMNPDTRTDYARLRPREIGTTATPEVIEATERRLDFKLYPLHRRLLETVGNGGFGPGDGLIGTDSGSLDVGDRSLVQLSEGLWPNKDVRLVPLCDWGDGIWSCIDVETGSVVTLSESGLFDLRKSLQSWLEDWVAGENLWEQMVVLGTTSMLHPLTKQPTAVQTVIGMKGETYIPPAR
jgi:hypothetical protein